ARPRDRARGVALRHRRAALDTETTGALVELLLRVLLDVDAAEGLAFATPLLRRRLLRARIARAGPVLLHPAVAPLLVRALERSHGRAVRPLALAVLLGGGVVRLGERPLRLRPRTLQRARQLRAPDLLPFCHLGHRRRYV